MLNEVKRHPFPWFLWSTVGFGLFYAPLTWASVYGESWFVAATWQLAMVEATQSGEVLFTLLGGILFLGDSLPSITGFAGITLIVTGMVINSFAAAD